MLHTILPISNTLSKPKIGKLPTALSLEVRATGSGRAAYLDLLGVLLVPGFAGFLGRGILRSPERGAGPQGRRGEADRFLAHVCHKQGK